MPRFLLPVLLVILTAVTAVLASTAVLALAAPAAGSPSPTAGIMPPVEIALMHA